jgi:hypothetical protein
MEATEQPSSTEAPGKSSRRTKFENLFIEFWGELGDVVFFKNAPNKKRVEWEIIGVERSYTRLKWTKGGYPNFVHLKRKDKPHHTVWTCSNQLIPAGFKTKGNRK